MIDFHNLTLQEIAKELGLKISKTSGTPFGGLAFNSSDVKSNASGTIVTLNMPLINNPYQNFVAMLRIAPRDSFVATNKGRMPLTAFSASMQAMLHQMYISNLFGEYDIRLIQLLERDTETQKTYKWFIELNLYAGPDFHARLSIPLQNWMLAYDVNRQRVQKAMLVLKRELNTINAQPAGNQIYETVAGAITLGLSGNWSSLDSLQSDWEVGEKKIELRLFQSGWNMVINVYVNDNHQPQISKAIRKILAFDETDLANVRFQSNV